MTKRIDQSSVRLFQASYNAKVIPTVAIAFVSTGNKLFHKYKLGNVLLSHFSDYYDDAMEFPQESIILDYESMEKTFVPRDSNITMLSPHISGYNIERAQSL